MSPDESCHDLSARSSCAAGVGRGVRACRLLAGVALAAGLAATSTGCLESDAWLWDPSVVGRWENTPTIVPVLDRIDVIESDSGEFTETTDVRPEDLIADPRDYRIGPGDALSVTVLDLFGQGDIQPSQEIVDGRGFISLPTLDPIYVAGMSPAQAETAIANYLIQEQIDQDPDIDVQLLGRRQATYGVFGFVQGVGRYEIPYPEYRLLDALTDAGGIPTTVTWVYVIRQVSLEDEPTAQPTPPDRGERIERPAPTDEGESIDQLLEDLLDEGAGEGEGGGDDMPSPGVLSGGPEGPAADAAQPGTRANAGFVDLSGEMGDGAPAGRAESRLAESRLAMRGLQDGDAPAIDLDDTGFEPPAGPVGRADRPAAADPERAGRWVFLDGRWQRVTAGVRQGLPEGDDPLAGDAGPIVTQRVIKVPADRLMRGDAEVNLVIRPGDMIRVQPPPSGVVYLGGPGINRAGVYELRGNSTLTVQRAVAAGSNLSAIAIPERVDLTRMIGPNRQATIRLNVRAIFEGTSPDIVLKPDDMLNFGTSFWATPMAVIRGGFRMSYGFGFLLDRNFGNDVFGPPPTNRGF